MSLITSTQMNVGWTTIRQFINCKKDVQFTYSPLITCCIFCWYMLRIPLCRISPHLSWGRCVENQLHAVVVRCKTTTSSGEKCPCIAPLKPQWKVLFTFSPGSQPQQRKQSSPTSSCIQASGVRKQTRPTEVVHRRTGAASIRWNTALLLLSLLPLWRQKQL